MDCLFCKIAKKEVGSSYIYEDDDVMAVLDIHPISPGHTFIIPKVHAESVLDLDEKTALALWKGIVKVEKMILETIKPEGFTVGINQGKSAGQVIEHLHIHVIPRWSTDGGKSLHSVVFNPPQENIEEIKQKILKGN